MTRIMFVLFALATGAAAYGGVVGAGGEKGAIAKSIRTGSGGAGIGYIGGVK